MTLVLVVVGLMVLGLMLIAIEILVIPGFGLIGVLGGVAMLAACYLAFAYAGPAHGALSLAGGVVTSAAMFWLLPKTKAGQKMVLRATIERAAPDPTLRALVEHEGVTLSALRPSGAAKIDGRQIDVVSDGEFVDAGTRVRVVRVEGARVIVEPIGALPDN